MAAATNRLEHLKQHLRAAHATRSCYMMGCRCLRCRAANSRYSCMRDAERRAGRTNKLVSTERVRAHLEVLSALGVGYKSVAAASGVSRTCIAMYKSGQRLWIREQAEARILAVDAAARAGNSLVDAGPTWARLDELISRGYSRAQLAKWLGMRHPHLQFNRRRVLWRTAVRVEKLCRLLDAGKLRRP